MDRDELQDRIRARRSGGGDPYRRGGLADEDSVGYGRFEPDPHDAQARRSRGPDERRWDAFEDRSGSAGGAAAAGAAAAGADAVDRPDVTREADDWQERPSIVPPIAPPEPAAPPPPPADEPAHVDNYDDAAYDDAAYPHEYDEWDDGRERRSSGAGAFAILGFLALGVLALLGGAVLAGVFSGDPPIGGVDATPTSSPTIQASIAPSEAASGGPTADASASPSGQPPASGEPVTFPDGFTAETQPCIPGSITQSGCDSNGASNAGQVEIWVGFTNGTSDDVLGASLIGPDGSTVGDGSIDLASLRCGSSCSGYTYFPFSGLGPGTYEVQITRNGEPAGSTTFEVT